MFSSCFYSSVDIRITTHQLESYIWKIKILRYQESNKMKISSIYVLGIFCNNLCRSIVFHEETNDVRNKEAQN